MAQDIVGFDKVAGVPIRINYEHHEIHGGSAYFITRPLTLGDGGDDEVLIVTPTGNKQAHMLLSATGTGETDFKFYEDTTRTGGTGVTAINRNRNSSNTSILTITHTPTGGSIGTLIAESLFGVDAGSGNNRQLSGGDGGGRSEIVLKSNTKYLVVVDSATASNRITITLDWYEHTTKDV